MPHTLTQRHTLSVGATRVVRINCTPDIDSGVLLTGTPSITEQDTSDLTLTSKQVNTVGYSDNNTGHTVAAGKGILFTVAGGSSGSTYTVLVSCDTDTAETVVYDMIMSFI